MSDALSTIRTFYDAFARRDVEAMAACYAPDVHFSDEVFTDLRGDAARDMWRMLCERSKDLAVTLVSADAQGDRGTARWIARYTFTQTGRFVENDISATFELANGRIVRHVDRFDFWRWSRQAFGPLGWLIGWTPILKGAVRKRANAALAAYRAKR